MQVVPEPFTHEVEAGKVESECMCRTQEYTGDQPTGRNSIKLCHKSINLTNSNMLNKDLDMKATRVVHGNEGRPLFHLVPVRARGRWGRSTLSRRKLGPVTIVSSDDRRRSRSAPSHASSSLIVKHLI